MIIFVNIGKSLAEGKSNIEATRRAWKLSLVRCKKMDYVIGVANGEPKCFFVLKDVFPDQIQKDRIAFDLAPCLSEEEENLRKILLYNNTNFKGIQRGKYLKRKS